LSSRKAKVQTWVFNAKMQKGKWEIAGYDSSDWFSRYRQGREGGREGREIDRQTERTGEK
jgi:hypothetical protein